MVFPDTSRKGEVESIDQPKVNTSQSQEFENYLEEYSDEYYHNYYDQDIGYQYDYRTDNEDDDDEEEECRLPSVPQTQICADGGASIGHEQQGLVKNTLECKWNLAEAQERLCTLELHNSESLEQEHAKAQTESWELKRKEDEWRQKEEELMWNERMNSWNVDTISKEGFNRSVINKNIKHKEAEEEADGKVATFVQKCERQIKHFGMLKRWVDSQRHLSDHPHLICEETANYLIKWCFYLQKAEKQALMEQVAHQAVVMQFIVEMGRNLHQDPRGCFRQFFEKAKIADEGYMEAFHTELEAFIQRVREFSQAKTAESVTMDKVVRDFELTVWAETPMPCWGNAVFSEELKRCFQLQDVQLLQNVLSDMDPQVAEHCLQHCIDAGLRICNSKEAKEERSEEPTMDTS
ncbi:hsp90 co-chaperone Cdc37-like 1 isoform X1 [Callorhinchus milii]|nr:hsp90 co-chaperone Cdc37-like 1 isoform X1 [Callorhinchus milii]